GGHAHHTGCYRIFTGQKVLHHDVARRSSWHAVFCCWHVLQLYLGIAIRSCHYAGGLHPVLTGLFLWPYPSISQCYNCTIFYDTLCRSCRLLSCCLLCLS